MKNAFLGALAVLVVGAIAAGAYYMGGQGSKPDALSPSAPSPTGEVVLPTNTPPTPSAVNANDAEEIKQALYKKNNWPAGTVTISVSANDGTYAKGMVNGEGGGGLFFAAKVNGVWKIVADGNGIIPCAAVAEYPDFPTTLIPSCYDEAKGSITTR